MKTVNVLGQPYQIIIKKYDEDECFDKNSFAAYCDQYQKQIVLCDMSTYKGWEKEPKETQQICQKENLRHEIVHAFFDESGLVDNSGTIDGPWAKNEEMVDWIAWQGPKIYAAWKEADAL